MSKNVGITPYLRLLLCIWSLLSSQVLSFKMDKMTINVQFNENTCNRALTIIYYPMNFEIHDIYISLGTFELVLAISTFKKSKSLTSHLLYKKNTIVVLLSCHVLVLARESTPMPFLSLPQSSPYSKQFS